MDLAERSTLTAGGGWSELTRRVWTDAVVLAIHRGFDIAEGWSFIVLDGRTLDQENVGSIGIDRALSLAIHAGELARPGLRGLLDASFVGHREATTGAEFPVSCDDEVAHQNPPRPR